MYSVKKRCRVCVDKIMETLSKSVETENKHIHILLNNKPADIIDISKDNEEVDDVDTNVVSDVIINEVTDEVTDKICVDKKNEVIRTVLIAFIQKKNHRGSMIKVIIPEYFFIKFSCGLVHCGTPSWFIDRGEYSKNIRAFLQLLKQISF